MVMTMLSKIFFLS